MAGVSLLTLDELLDSTGGMYVLGQGDLCISNVQTDSRLVSKDTLFVPLIGEFQDGHKYIPSAIEKGASCIFICQKNFEQDSQFFVDASQKNPEVIFIAVNNTMTALQKAAAKYVEKFPDLIKIAVTGSSGKTTTKEIIASVLKQKFNVVMNQGNLNSETGLPLSVFNIRKEHQVGIFEMGMNRQNEIGEISAVLKARIAVVTNIGTAHIGMLGSRQNIAAEKAKVFDHFYGIGTGFIPKDDDYADFLKDQCDGRSVFYGEGCDSSVKFLEDKGLEGTEFSVDGIKTVLNLPGKYNYKNALAAVAVGKFLGLQAQEICAGIQALEPMFGRSQVVKGKYTIVQDCYNANPDSMEKALEFIGSVKVAEKKVLVLGDMLELGEDSKSEHIKAGEQAVKTNSDWIIFAGDEMKFAYDAVKDSFKNCVWFGGRTQETIESIAAKLKDVLGSGDMILLKGSRGMGLERLTKILEEGNE